MADQLVTPSELASFLQQDLDTATATLLIEMATGKIQSACGQRLIAATATFVIDVDPCDFGPWLDLPQRPVRAVNSVLIEGVPYTDWLLRSQRLWRYLGWIAQLEHPSQVTVNADCGYLAGAPGLQPARNDCLVLCAAGYGNPSAVQSEQIDDYRVTYAAEADARMQLTPAMRDRLRALYGSPAYVTTSS